MKKIKFLLCVLLLISLPFNTFAAGLAARVGYEINMQRITVSGTAETAQGQIGALVYPKKASLEEIENGTDVSSKVFTETARADMGGSFSLEMGLPLNMEPQEYMVSVFGGTGKTQSVIIYADEAAAAAVTAQMKGKNAEQTAEIIEANFSVLGVNREDYQKYKSNIVAAVV